MSDDEETAVKYVTVYLKSGASFTVRVSEWITQRSKITGELVGFRWTDAAELDGDQLDYINLDQVAAVVSASVTP